ncbi:helix-turn-helix domain-containing protein [Comamonadaceae bacterium PP-2]
MRSKLSTDFSFADFRRVAPINAENVYELVLQRQGHRVTVRRTGTAIENLKRVMGATFRIANRSGFAAMSLRDLCKESGLSMGGLYGYIGTKDDLAAMIEDVVRHASEEIPAWFESWEPGHAKLEAMLRGHIYLSEILHPWFYFVFMDSRVLPAKQKSVAKFAELHFQSKLAELALASGVHTPQTATLFASHALALAQDWYVKRWKYVKLEVTIDAFADSVCLVLAGRQPSNALQLSTQGPQQ